MKQIHQNSVDSFHLLDRQARYKLILSVYQAYSRPLSDREVGVELGCKDLNYVKPRITEMIKGKAGKKTFTPMLRKCPSKWDDLTKRTVRTAVINDGNGTGLLPFPQRGDEG